MKKTNFLKGLALAAVALVCGFATSCSEEELSIKGNQTEIKLPAASASVSISVVDLEAGKLVGNVSTIDATSAIGSTLTVECPAVVGYTVAAPVEVAIPALKEGQSVNVPVTFYVISLEHALAELIDNTYFTFPAGSEVETTTAPLAVSAKSDNWNGYTVANTDEDAIRVWADYAYLSGWEFVSEVEAEEEETEELAASRAAETSIIELIKLNKPSKNTYYDNWDVNSMICLTVNATQYIREGVAQLIDWETQKPVATFVGKRYSYGVWGEEETITHDNGHDAPSHDNSHNGHDHGGNSNAGGGIGGDNAGE